MQNTTDFLIATGINVILFFIFFLALYITIRLAIRHEK